MTAHNHGRYCQHPRGLALLLAFTGCGGADVTGPPGATTTDPGTSGAPVTSGPHATDTTAGPGDTADTDDADELTDDGNPTEPGTTGPDPTTGPGTTTACDPGDEPQEPPPEPGVPTDYTGKQYDFGGVVTQIAGQVPEVEVIADSIVAEAAQTVQEIAAERATLTYGRIAPDPCAPQQLITYPGPPDIPASDQYTVTVTQAGVDQPSFVHKILARKPDTNRGLDTSWTSFSFAGPIAVRVTKLQGEATGCIVRPYSAGVVATFADGACSFTLERPGKLSVEFEPNIHNPVLHPMLVFADPPEVDVPAPDAPGVRYFGPGVHKPGSGQPIASGDTIYLAGGAWVEAAFLAAGPVEDVVIKGRGVLSGLFLDTGDQDSNKDQPGMIDIPYQASRNVLIEGITLVDGPRYNIRALAQSTTITNVKVMSWWFSTDGMVGGNKTLIQDNFIKVNDDSIKLHWGDTIARRNVLWQLENGGSGTTPCSATGRSSRSSSATSTRTMPATSAPTSSRASTGPTRSATSRSRTSSPTTPACPTPRTATSPSTRTPRMRSAS